MDSSCHRLLATAAAILFMAVGAGISSAQDYTQQQQIPGRDRNQDMINALNQAAINPYASEEEDQPADTTSKEPKVRKPLESYFFDDSLRQEGSFAWTADLSRNKVRRAVIDTITTGFQISRPDLTRGVGDAYQGALGGASIPLSYFDRRTYRDFTFGQPYDAYNVFPESALFFNVKRPLTIFTYLTAGQKQKAEENFGITHAQNISPSSGFNLDYKSRGTKGVYDWQKQRAKNLSMAFSHTGKKYSVHAGYIYNTIQNRENGGVQNDTLITSSRAYEQSNVIPVNLTDAYNLIKDNTFYIVQSYGIPLRKLTDEDFSIADRSSIFVGHSFRYSRWHRVYSDSRAATMVPTDEDNVYRSFYENWFIDPRSTNDSIAEKLISNKVFVQLQPFDRDGIIGTIDAGVGMDNHVYYQFVPDMWLQGQRNVKKTEYYVYGSVEGKFRRYLSWGGDAQYHPTGYRSGDIKAGADLAVSAYIKEQPLTLSGRFSHDRRSAGYWSERYFSNHFAWSNSFDKENETRIEASLTMQSAGIELAAYQSVVNNKVYYNSNMQPAQANESVSVTGVYLRKDFSFRVHRSSEIHLNHRAMLQWSTSQEIIPVPLGGAYFSYFFEFNVIRNRPDILRVQLGIDARINTKWYAPGWNPSAAVLYNQRETKVGEYPMVDLYLNAKWKRMRILLKMEHLNDDMFGSRNYFSLPHYPLNNRVFKLGFSWSFYD